MGKGLIPADLDTWKQRRRGEWNTIIFSPTYASVYILCLVVVAKFICSFLNILCSYCSWVSFLIPGSYGQNFYRMFRKNGTEI